MVFSEHDNLFPAGDFCRALDHDPVLGAMVVHLQAQAGLGIDLDALDFKAVAFVDAVIPAPGAMNLAMG